MRGSTGRALQALAATTLFLGSASAAWACSMALWHSVVPTDGATDVPLNAQVSVALHDHGEGLGLYRVLADESLEEVSTTRTQRPGSNGYPQVLLVPEASLNPNARYVVTSEFTGDVTRFTTGTTEDHTPPAPPTFELGEPVPYTPASSPQSGGACWVDTGFLRYTARSEGAATFTLYEERSFVASGLPPEGSLSFECPAKSRTYEAELVAVDLAGNESEPVRVTLEEKCVKETPAYGCSAAASAPGVAALALWGLGLLGVGARRRR